MAGASGKVEKPAGEIIVEDSSRTPEFLIEDSSRITEREQRMSMSSDEDYQLEASKSGLRVVDTRSGVSLARRGSKSSRGSKGSRSGKDGADAIEQARALHKALDEERSKRGSMLSEELSRAGTKEFGLGSLLRPGPADLAQATTLAEAMANRRRHSSLADEGRDSLASGGDAPAPLNGELRLRLTNMEAKIDKSLDKLSQLAGDVTLCSRKIDHFSAGFAAFAKDPKASVVDHFPPVSVVDLDTGVKVTTAKATERSFTSFSKLKTDGSAPGESREHSLIFPARRITSGSRSTGSSISLTSAFADTVSKIIGRQRERSECVEKVWDVMNDNPTFIAIVRVLVLLSVAVALSRTADEDGVGSLSTTMTVLETLFDMIFLAEIAVRFFTCQNRLAFCCYAYNILDACVGILPPMVRIIAGFRLPAETGEAFSIRTFLICVVPILRLLKILRSFNTFHLLLKAFRLAAEALPVLMFTLSVLVLFFSTIIYMVEPRSNIESYPRALWLTIVTTSTVGYGDAVPETIMGYLIVGMLTVISALYMAIPIGIVGNTFNLVWQDRDRLLLMERIRDRFLTTGYRAADVPALFHAFDHDNDGTLNLREFSDMVDAMDIGIDQERVLELFYLFDRNNNEGIDDSEFVRILFPEAYTEIYLPIIRRNSFLACDRDSATDI